MNDDPNSAGVAALDICESLLLTLVANKILTSNQVLGLLQDVSDLHNGPAHADGHEALHRSTAQRLEKLIRSKVAVAH